jgi:hypothetical protein
MKPPSTFSTQKDRFRIDIDSTRIKKIENLHQLLQELWSSPDFYRKVILFKVVGGNGGKEIVILYISAWLVNPSKLYPDTYTITLFKGAYTVEANPEIVAKIKEGGYIVSREGQIEVTKETKPQHYQCICTPLIPPIWDEEKRLGDAITINEKMMKKD